MIRPIRATLCAVVAASLTVLSSASLTAQKPGAAPTCATLLTADELTQAVGVAMKDMGPDTRGVGETECDWMLRGAGGFKTASVQFYDLAAVKANTLAPTLEKFFDQYVSAAEGTPKPKRELVPGIGQKAAFVAADPQVLVIVQRADGVARIVGNNLTKDQILAIARAVATP